MRRLLLIVSMLGLSLVQPRPVAAQTSDDDYYPYAEPESRFEEPTADSALFYRAIRSTDDLYAVESAYRLPRVLIHRGGERTATAATLFGIEAPARLFRSLRLLGADEARSVPFAATADGLGATGSRRTFRLTDDEPLRAGRLGAQYAVEGYRFGLQGAFDRSWRSGWRLAASLDARTGRDARIDGVFTNALTAAIRLTRRSASGVVWTTFAALPISMRGLHEASTEEAFRLTGDRYYNPAWGFQNGKVRNARVRRELLPYLVSGLALPVGTSTTLQLSAGVEAGISRQSALDWFDARSPLPDNYRNMPSWAGDRETEEVWAANDPRYTQVAWDELIVRNRLAGGSAVFILEDRVEQRTNASACAHFTTRFETITFDYGVRGAWNRSRYYKELRDLLGADYLIDIDRFVIDDDTYSNRYQNDLRNPSRTIREGDRFAYDYALTSAQAAAWLRAEHRSDRLQAGIGAELGTDRRWREGFYEKELFPGDGSFGRSRRIVASPYAFKADLGWSFSPRSALEALLTAGAAPQTTADLFIQPHYNNRTVEDPCLERYYGARLQFRRTGEALDLQLAAYATHRSGGIRTQRYYDDLAAVYSDLTVSGISTTCFGLEAAAVWRIARRWTLSATAAWCRARYADDATVTVVADTDNSTIDLQAVSHLRNCRPGNVPQFAATAALRYYGPHGWGFRLSAGVAADRRIEAAPLRRTDRIARQGTTPEGFAAFTRQERLPDAFTLDAAVSKSFRLPHSEIYLLLALHNLTGDESPAYGYESLRTQHPGSGSHAIRMPQANRYRYAYPRSITLTAGWRF